MEIKTEVRPNTIVPFLWDVATTIIHDDGFQESRLLPFWPDERTAKEAAAAVTLFFERGFQIGKGEPSKALKGNYHNG